MIQLQALNKLLQDRDSSFLTLNNLSEEYFSDYVQEYRFIQNHLTTYGNLPDMATFISKFPSFDVLEVNESTRYILDALVEDRNKRFLAKTFNQIREALIKNDTDRAMKLFTASQEDMSKAVHLESVDILKDMTRYNDYLDRADNYSNFYVTTGYKELDRIIGGWDRCEELGVIIAPSGVGKSWMLIKCAIAAAEQGLRVGIYSGEMSERKVGYRLDTLISHISNYKINRGDTSIQQEYKRYLDNLSKTIPGSIKVLTPTAIGGPAGVRALRAFIEKDSLDILFVDQHSLLEDDRGARNPVEKASNISRDLKNLQVMKKIPIIAAAQRNRQSEEDNTTDKTKVAQSYRITQDATVVINIMQEDGALTLEVTKSRDSSGGKKLKYAMDLDKGNLTYIPTESDGLEGKDAQELKKQFDTISVRDSEVF